MKWWKVTTGETPRSWQSRADAPVVVEGGERELTLGGLDPAPFQREAVGAEAEVGDEVDVLVPAVERVTGVAARRHASRRRVVLPVPPVVVGVAALDLMGRGGGSPEEPGGNPQCRLGCRATASSAASWPDPQCGGALGQGRVAQEAGDVLEVRCGALPRQVVDRGQQASGRRATSPGRGTTGASSISDASRSASLGALRTAAAQGRVPVRHRRAGWPRGGRSARAPSRPTACPNPEAREPVGAVAHEGEPVGDRQWADAVAGPHRLFVGDDVLAAVELHHAPARARTGRGPCRGCRREPAPTPVSSDATAAADARASSASSSTMGQTTTPMATRAASRRGNWALSGVVDALAGLVAGPQVVAERLDRRGRWRRRRGSPGRASIDSTDWTTPRTAPDLAPFGALPRRGAVEVAEQFVGPVDEMDPSRLSPARPVPSHVPGLDVEDRDLVGDLEAERRRRSGRCAPCRSRATPGARPRRARRTPPP